MAELSSMQYAMDKSTCACMFPSWQFQSVVHNINGANKYHNCLIELLWTTTEFLIGTSVTFLKYYEMRNVTRQQLESFNAKSHWKDDTGYFSFVAQ